MKRWLQTVLLHFVIRAWLKSEFESGSEGSLTQERARLKNEP